MKVSICIPSYKRPKVETLDYLPMAKVFVDEGEYQDYIEVNPKENIVSVPSGVQGNLCRIRNYILDHEFEKGADVVLIVDDDMQGVYRWENKEKYKIPTEEFEWMVKKYSVMARDLGAYFWGINIASDKMFYREYTPFSMVSYIGGPFQAFLKGGELRYDENFPLKEDYDMTLQQLNRYRKVLRVNSHFYQVKQSEQIGGCAVYRNYQEEERQLIAFQEKWGSHIVKLDKSDSLTLKKKKVRIDYNPIIKVPIKGV